MGVIQTTTEQMPSPSVSLSETMMNVPSFHQSALLMPGPNRGEQGTIQFLWLVGAVIQAPTVRSISVVVTGFTEATHMRASQKPSQVNKFTFLFQLLGISDC